MLSKESQMLSFFNYNSKIQDNYNISHFEFIRRRQSENKIKKTSFSNNLVKHNIDMFKGCQQVVQLKLNNQYSPRKPHKLGNNTFKKLQKSNPYKQAIQLMRQHENVMLGSLLKSVNISRKQFSEHKGSSSMKQSAILLKRSKTGLSLHQLKSQFHQNVRNYEKIALKNPQNTQESRMIQSALPQRSKRTKIRSLSVLSDYFKSKSSSEPKLYI